MFVTDAETVVPNGVRRTNDRFTLKRVRLTGQRLLRLAPKQELQAAADEQPEAAYPLADAGSRWERPGIRIIPIATTWNASRLAQMDDVPARPWLS
jgi:hypothetical protein